MKDDEINDILFTIRRLQNEIKDKELSEIAIEKRISKYRTLALGIDNQLLTISRKILQADFICQYENKLYNNYNSKTEKTKILIREFVCPASLMDENVKKEDSVLKNDLLCKLEKQRKSNARKEEMACNIEQELNALKIKNVAIKEKLLRNLEEAENTERHLEDVLEQIQYFIQENNFIT